MEKGIEFLTKKRNELDNLALENRNKMDYDEYNLLVEKVTFLDELISEMKKE